MIGIKAIPGHMPHIAKEVALIMGVVPVFCAFGDLIHDRPSDRRTDARD